MRRRGVKTIYTYEDVWGRLFYTVSNRSPANLPFDTVDSESPCVSVVGRRIMYSSRSSEKPVRIYNLDDAIRRLF